MTDTPGFLAATAALDPGEVQGKAAELWQLIIEADGRAATEKAFTRRDTLIEALGVLTGETADDIAEQLERMRQAEREAERRAEEIDEALMSDRQAAHDEMLAAGELWAEAG